MKLIIIDTNFLIYCAKYKIDLVRELERICDFLFHVTLPIQVISELENLKNFVKGKDKEAVELALDIIKINNLRVVDVDAKNADDAILKLFNEAKKIFKNKKIDEVIIATMDRELRKRFKKDKGTKTISIRQKKYLTFN